MKTIKLTKAQIEDGCDDGCLYHCTQGFQFKPECLEMKTIYIAGKISGMEEKAYNLFAIAEVKLLDKGYKVVNPMRLKHNHDKRWISYMRECIAELVYCDGIHLLPNWWRSRGARIEYVVALLLGIKRIKN